MSRLFGFLVLFGVLPAVVPLFCYKCLLPAITPLPRDCIRIPTLCASGQSCLSSRATAQKGKFEVVLREKSCALPKLCGITGAKIVMGLNFTFNTECCDENLCNGAAVPPRSVFPVSALLCLLLSFVFVV